MANQSSDNSFFKFCTVEYVDDSSKALRVKVRIAPYDNGKDITQEPCVENNFNGVQWCFPMLPKMMHVNPKVGELVVVFCQEPDSPFSQRLFLGPVISQDYMMDYDYDFPPTDILPKSSARRMLSGSTADKTYIPLPSPDGDGENEGTIPEREDIAIRGRGNSDIILTDDEVRIRCGFKKTPHGTIKKKLNFNDKDLAYILMRYRNSKDEVSSYDSSINIVADRVNILSHDSIDYFKLGDRKNLISDDEMDKILKQAHELPYGDVLVKFLKKFIDVFNRHTHPYNRLPPSLNEADIQALEPNWDNMLSKSVRIN